MACSPKWKVYDAAGNYQASCKEPEACAFLIGLYGEGATVRYGHRLIVWFEGKEKCSAADSYDTASLTMQRRAATNAEL